MMRVRAEASWWSRNWGWSFPLGCLGLIVLIAGFAALLASLVFGIMKSSVAYKEPLARARAHAAVQEALGTPVEAGLLVSGTINVSGPSGRAELAIPLSGPKGRGTLYVVGSKSAGQWQFSKLVVEVKGTGVRLDLSGGP